MKNRKLLLIVSLVLAMTMSLGGTLAYLTDTDSQVNTMVLGNVQIDQMEYERALNESGAYVTYNETEREGSPLGYKLKEFTQNKPLLPVVGNPGEYWEDQPRVYFAQLDDDSNMGFQKVLNSNAKNVLDKFVFVKNTGKTDAYVRTLIAYEIGSIEDAYGDLVMTAYNDYWTCNVVGNVEINGNNYTVVEYLYEGGVDGGNGKHPDGIVHPGDYTYPSLTQVYMKSEGTNEDVQNLDGNGNGTYDILVLSQAIQAAGWTATEEKSAAQVALDTGFGEANETNVKAWFGDVTPKYVSTLAELQAEIDAAVDGATIVLANDIEGNVTVTQKAGVNLVIDGANHKFTGVMTVFGNGNQAGAETLTIKNIDFVAAEGAESCIVSPDRTVNNKYSYAHNVTVENCTFTDPDGVVNCAAIRHNDGGDKNWVVGGCAVDNTMHSLLQINNVAGKLTINNCEVYSKNGVNLNSCTNVEMNECKFDVTGYAVRFGVNSGGNPDEAKTFVFNNSTLKSACNDGDAVIIFRTSAANNKTTLTLNNTQLVGALQYTGAENINKN